MKKRMLLLLISLLSISSLHAVDFESAEPEEEPKAAAVVGLPETTALGTDAAEPGEHLDSAREYKNTEGVENPEATAEPEESSYTTNPQYHESTEDQAYETSTIFHIFGTLGLNMGKTEELVYSGGDVRSRLDWDEHFSPFINIQVAFQFKYFNWFLLVQTAIPTKTGTVEDTDYLDNGEVNKYSQHDSHMDSNFIISNQISFLFQVAKQWGLGPFVGFTYQHKSWSAIDGWSQYPAQGESWSTSTPKTDMISNSISYNQVIWYPSVGATLVYMFSGKNNFSFSAAWQPYTYVKAIDYHHLRDLKFTDTMSGLNGVHFTLRGTGFPFKNHPELGIFADLGYKFFSTKGDTDVVDMKLNQKVNEHPLYDAAGSLRHMFSLSIGVVYRGALQRRVSK